MHTFFVFHHGGRPHTENLLGWLLIIVSSCNSCNINYIYCLSNEKIASVLPRSHINLSNFLFLQPLLLTTPCTVIADLGHIRNDRKSDHYYRALRLVWCRTSMRYAQPCRISHCRLWKRLKKTHEKTTVRIRVSKTNQSSKNVWSFLFWFLVQRSRSVWVVSFWKIDEIEQLYNLYIMQKIRCKSKEYLTQGTRESSLLLLCGFVHLRDFL